MRMIKKLMLMTMIMTELKPVLKMFQGDGLVHNFLKICPARAKKKKKKTTKKKQQKKTIS